VENGVISFVFILGGNSMKKNLFFWLLLGGAVLFASSLYAQAPTAVIRELSGRVEIQAPGDSAWAPASIGMVIEKDAKISTGFKSGAVIALGNSTITVRPLTRLTLEEIARLQDNEEAGLYLETGRVRAEVTPPSGGKIDFTVRSPMATASVRGTIFDFDTVNLTVHQGRIRYTTPMGSLAMVRGGEKSTVNEKTNGVSAPRTEAVLGFTPVLASGSSETGSSITGESAVAAAPGIPVPSGTPVGPSNPSSGAPKDPTVWDPWGNNSGRPGDKDIDIEFTW
jgi:hypothetical protein